MRYIGSKAKLNDWMFGHLQQQMAAIGMTPGKTRFTDACSGTASVGVHAASLGFHVTSNDIMAYGYHIARGRLLLPPDKQSEAEKHVAKMNQVTPIEGHFTKSYSPTGGRMYLTQENAMFLDASRAYISTVDDPVMQSYLIHCLIEAMSGAVNTTGTHYAYLKTFQGRSMSPITVEKVPHIYAPTSRVFHHDILGLLADPTYQALDEEEGVLYIDPPYNQRQYAPAYHLYETLARGDDPTVTGVSGYRHWENESSAFCSPLTARDYLIQIVKASKARLIMISYSTDGLLSVGEIATALSEGAQSDDVACFFRDYKRYKADQNSADTDMWLDTPDDPAIPKKGRTFHAPQRLMECLFIVEKDNSDALALFG